MRRNLLLAATSLTMLSTTLSFAQTDADNFYKSSTVSTESNLSQSVQNESDRQSLSSPRHERK